MSPPTAAVRLGTFAASDRPRGAPLHLRTLLSRHLADTVACAAAATGRLREAGLGGHAPLPHGEAAAGATLIGGGMACTRAAALVAGTLTRYLDANDTFLPRHLRTVGHFSDATMAVVATAESVQASGPELLDALVVTYEVQGWLAEHFDWPQAGYHPTGLAAVGAAMGAGRLLGLDARRLTNAATLAASCGLILNTWLRPAGGEIPTVKGLAAGLGSERGLLCAELATTGGAAPPDAFEVVWSRAGDHLRRTSDEEPGAPWTIDRNAIKRVPAQIYTQSVAEAAGRIHDQGARLDDAARIVVRSHRHACGHVQGSPRAFAPRTRGDADHSTPFVAVMTLRDGLITPQTYDDEPWLCPEVASAMRAVELVIDDDLDRRFSGQGQYPATVVMTDRAGREYRADVAQFAGHPECPLSDVGVHRKLEAFVGDPEVWGPGAGHRLLTACDTLLNSSDLSALTELLAQPLGWAAADR